MIATFHFTTNGARPSPPADPAPLSAEIVAGAVSGSVGAPHVRHPDALDQAGAHAPNIIDGRHRKRAENVDRVRSAILDCLAEGVTPALPVVARRAGVTTRSVYRYFGDIDAAVTDAIAVQRERVFSAFRSEPSISSTSPLDERVAMLALRRLRLEALITPITVHLRLSELDELLDAEVDAAFALECRGEAGVDEELAALLRGVFALASITALRQAFDDDPNRVVRGVARLVAAVVRPTH